MEENIDIKEKVKKQKKIRKILTIILVIQIFLITIIHVYNVIKGQSSINYDSMTEKPIIYIYPQEETNVNVKLGYPEYLTCTYPKYENEGWNVIAKPNGDLEDIKTGKKFYALYWEGIRTKKLEIEDGFIVEGKDVAEFLEEKLEILGLNDREKEEFIVYWLPMLEKNEYNLIRFYEKEEIDEMMPLEINPEPDTTIRVLMGWKKVDGKMNVKEQKLEQEERKGYTVVEWGGTEIQESLIK